LHGSIGELAALPSPEEYGVWRMRAGMGENGHGLSNEASPDTHSIGRAGIGLVEVQNSDKEDDNDEM